MTLATQTLEVIGIRRKDAATVNVELGILQSGDSAPMPFGSHLIEVANADVPQLGASVTLTFSLQA